MPNKSAIIIETDTAGKSCIALNSPTKLPNANGFLWNKAMVMQVNCRGYVTSQFMQPEPAKYSHAPNMEAKSFIQPEHSYFTHHPGRFFYLKNDDTREIISLPYEPMRSNLDLFSFRQTTSEISWLIKHKGLVISIAVNLTENDLVESWSITITNNTNQILNISLYPYFTISYMSWMNQSASYNKELNAIVAHSVTPYQKVDDYFKNQHLKDLTFMLSDKAPVAWHANQRVFEGEGGLHHPSALQSSLLQNVDARYETPVAVMQFKYQLGSKEQQSHQLLFGPAKDEAEIIAIKEKYLGQSKLIEAKSHYQSYLDKGKACLTIHTENLHLNDFFNHWLPRQMFYHGDVNRLSTDPQTRNYVQDNMGMAFIDSHKTRQAYLLAVSQQTINGAMPEGVLLHDKAELKYINQIPHADHGVWLPICLTVYLNETNDLSLLSEKVAFADTSEQQTFSQHIELALDYLINATDERGLSFIEQGDWCDPMNMVGYQGKGVSAWLSLATAYALVNWCELCDEYTIPIQPQKYLVYKTKAKEINCAVNKFLWHGQWFARGITDAGRVFGTNIDEEGKIYLNPQSWALLSGAASKDQQTAIIAAIGKHLLTPKGSMMLAPSYTTMVDDIGRITQKHPGVSENGSVYNHAAIFYIYALYQHHQNNLAFELLLNMLPTLDTADITGQLPVFLPNYYRGAYHQLPDQAGRSSHLFNTGTVSWLYRCVVEELCGLKGRAAGLEVSPKLPTKLKCISGTRYFRGAIVEFSIEQCPDIIAIEILLDECVIAGNIITGLNNEQHYRLQVNVPQHQSI